MVTEGGNQDGFCRDCGQAVWWQNERLVNHDGTKWCYGKDRTRMAMERWHALPGMAQYVVPASEGQVCHCLAREKPHIHQITEVPDGV